MGKSLSDSPKRGHTHTMKSNMQAESRKKGKTFFSLFGGSPKQLGIKRLPPVNEIENQL